MPSTTYPIHPVAKLFPLMEGEEFEKLKTDISANGLREPIWTHQGKIIDGRNRLRACQDLGIDPKFREWDGRGSLVGFVVSLNLHRRHLTPSQCAALGAEIEPLLAAEAKERQRAGGRKAGRGRPAEKVEAKSPQPKRAPQAREKAAQMTGATGRRVADAKAVKKKDPKLFEKVKAGKVKLNQAKRILKRKEKAKELRKKAKAAAAQPSRQACAWQVHTGDCIDLIPKEVKPASVRLAFADPPYNQGVDYGTGKNADRLSDPVYLNWCRRWMQAVAKTLTPDGSFWVLISDEYAAQFATILTQIGLTRKQWLIWFESFGVCASGGRGFTRSSRHLLWYVKDPRRFVFHPEPVTRPSWRQRNGDKRADPSGRTWDSVWGIDPPIARLVDNAAERVPGFPTQLPLALLRPIVGCASDPGDLVLDPFSGSGTTGAAALELGRPYVGFEKSRKFAELSWLRLQGVTT